MQERERMVKEYWITNSRFKLIVIVMILIWSSLLLFWYIKADEITKDPCSICAEKLGEKVSCTTTLNYIPVTKDFYPNGTSMLINQLK